MKRTFVLLLVAQLLASAASNAQLLRQAGLKIAYTSANQTFRYTNFTWSTLRLPGLSIAAYAEWLDLPVVSVITQLEYAQRGMRLEGTRTANDPTPFQYRIDHRCDYLSVPIMLKCSLPSLVVCPYLAGGPRADFFLSHRTDEDWFPTVYEGFKKSSIGASAACGVQVNAIPGIVLLLEGRYNWDLADAYASEELKVRNDSFDLWLGVAF